MENIEPIEPPEEIEGLIEEISRRAAKLGLHYQHGQAMFNGDSDMMESREAMRAAMAVGSAEMVFSGVFTIGDLAWSDHVQNPEEEAVKDEFLRIMPTDIDIQRAALQEKIKNGLFDGLKDDD